MMDIETQCKAIPCSILVKFVKETRIEPIFSRPIELSYVLRQASLVIKYLHQKPLQKYTASLHFLTLNPAV